MLTIPAVRRPKQEERRLAVTVGYAKSGKVLVVGMTVDSDLEEGGNFRLSYSTAGVLVCSGCCDKIPQAG